MVRPGFSFESSPIGLVARAEGVIAFFGNRHSSESAVQEAFPGLQFRYLTQTHSADVIGSRLGRPEADAHWTDESGVALAVRTADCLPVLFASRDGRAVAAVHAGWRGIENEILLRTGVALLEAGHLPSSFRAAVGPGIGPRSFEVGTDVAERLEACFRKVRFDQSDTSLSHHEFSGKKRVDLPKIAFSQLRAAGLAESAVAGICADTCADPGYFSYRREGAGAGRQVSFVARV